MAKVYLDDSILIAIANAIRTKAGTSETMLPSEMPTAIAMIGNTANTLETRGDNNEEAL